MDIEIVWNPQDQGLPVEPLSLFNGWNGFRRYVAAVHQGRVVGLVCYTDHREGAMVLSYLDVARNWQSKGVASRLAQALIKEAGRRNTAIGVTSYTKQGELRLKPVLHRAAQSAGVALLEDWVSGCGQPQWGAELAMAA